MTVEEYLAVEEAGVVVKALTRCMELRDLEVSVREEGRLWELRAVAEESPHYHRAAGEYFGRADKLRAERMALLDRCGLR